MNYDWHTRLTNNHSKILVYILYDTDQTVVAERKLPSRMTLTDMFDSDSKLIQ